MMGKKDYESSDSDDSDFVIDLHHDSSDNSLQSERETITAETNDTYDNNNLKKRKKNIVNRNHLTKKKRYFSDKTQKGKLVTTKNLDNSQNLLSPNDDKARADSLWKHFLNDTATSSKAPLCISTNRTETSPDLNEVIDTKQTNYSHTVNFEKTTDTKACAINKIIKNEKIALIPPNKNIDKLATSSELHVQENCLKKQHFSSILHNIKKKSKLTTLEKSKLDWNQFKEEHNLEEEISHYNRGKSGYLERQDFLQRADSRQFEIEKELRNVGKRKTR